MSDITSGPEGVGARVEPTVGTLERFSTSGLLLLPPCGAPVKLNAPAATVWECVRSGLDRDAIITVMVEKFEQDRDLVAPLVDDVIDQLIMSELAYRSP